jgi:uncharacterized glyoxalase superfamily protein PhnB
MPQLDAIGIVAADVDNAFTAVTEGGAAMKEPPFDAPWGQRYATVYDPDQNPVDLYAPLA